MGLNKQALLNLMSYPDKISENDITELREVLNNYPYFQLGHSILAKVTHDQQAPDAYDCLSKAAIYAPNRKTLRALFYDDLHIVSATPYLPATEEEEKEDENIETKTPADDNDNSASEVEDLPVENEENILIQDQEEEIIQSDEVYNELEENLRKLRESKNKFSEEEEEHKKKIADEVVSDSIVTKNIDEEKDSNDQYPSIPLDDVTPQEEVFEPTATHQKVQIELIDKFINSQDTTSFKIKPPADTDEITEDLSHRSTEVADNLISENLAKIYIKQGKKDKAIEIYQKLIWKFPQKKAYFANQIESLKDE